MKPALRVALVGTPNAGKTALFNALTSSHQRVANYAGVTTDSVEADLRFEDGQVGVLLDLPGSYSLRPYTDEENVLCSMLTRKSFDVVCLVLDATQLARGMRFALDVLDYFSSTSIPVVIALNMMDLAKKRGIEIDVDALSLELGVPVIPTIALKRKDQTRLRDAIAAQAPRLRPEPAQVEQSANNNDAILHLFKRADAITKKVLKNNGASDTFSAALDRLVLHPVFGFFILVLVLGVTFQLMFNLAEIPMGWIENIFSDGSNVIKNIQFIPQTLRDFLTDGILAGIGGTLVFLPQILILFTLILFLEDFGFMARAVFLLDHMLGRFGLHGRAFLPLLSSYACAIPGIMATKAIETRMDRVVTVMMIPLMTCSARIPVYTLLIAAFVPNRDLGFGLKLQGLVMLGLYVVGTVFAVAVGAVLKMFFLKGARPPLFMELPSYKWPSFRALLRALVYRARIFVTRVGTVILALTVLIWASLSYPKPEAGVASSIETSYAAQLGQIIEPVLKPIGFNWKISMALIPSFAAREVLVSALSSIYAVEDTGDEESTLKTLTSKIQAEWSFATGMSLLVWFIFAPQCFSTFVVARRELNSTPIALVMIAYLLVLAYAMSWITYRVFV